MRPAWAEINLDNLAFNMRQIRANTNPASKIMAVVKADAYGHGIVQTSKVVLENGADRLGVAILDEAIALREQGITAPIIILGYVPVTDLSFVTAYDLTPTVFEFAHAEVLSKEALKSNKKVNIHIKIDTGMGRLGFLPEEGSVDIIDKIVNLPGVFVEGIYTHLSYADAEDRGYTLGQLERFNWFLERLEQKNIFIPIKHAANSAGILNYPQSHFDMVRPGIVLYGLLPSDEMQNTPEFKPVMSLKAQVASVKHIPAGNSIGYGCSHKLDKDSVIAVLPLGYADGYTRHFSNTSQALVCGKRVPLVGRVCMDQIMVDITDVSGVAIGDEAVLLGKQGDEEITAEELANQAETINYEIVCMISHRVPRKYVGSRLSIYGSKP